MYFPFTGNATDASGNGNIATVNGPTLTTDRFGDANAAYFFDGINDYISVINGPGMKPPFPFSLSAWVKIYDTANGVNFLFCNDYTENVYYGSWYNFSSDVNGNFSANLGDSQFIDPSHRRTKTANQALTFGVWYHVAAVVSSETSMKLYVNCKEVPGFYSGSGGNLAYSTTGNSVIGVGDGGIGGIMPTYTNADIDELRFYDRALNDDEIIALYFFPNPPPAQTFSFPQDTIDLACGGTVNLDATTNGVIAYEWSTNSTQPGITVNTPGTYWAKVDDGCTIKYDTVVVVGTSGGNLTVSQPPNICTGESVTITASGFLNYTWSPATGLNTNTGPTVTASPSVTTTYTVVASDTCGTDSATVVVRVSNAVDAAFGLIADNCTGNATFINQSLAGANAYAWYVNQIKVSEDSNAVYNFVNTGQYNVSLVTNPGTNCADTLTTLYNFTRFDESTLYIPNSFTPNGDGINEGFKAYGDSTCFKGELLIFNSWGELIYETNDPLNNAWNGKYKDEKVPVGVYAYRLILNSGKSYYGMVALIR